MHGIIRALQLMIIRTIESTPFATISLLHPALVRFILGPVFLIAAVSMASPLLCGAAPATPNPYGLQRYSSPDSLFVLHKPPTWTVRQGDDHTSLSIVVSNPAGTSSVEFLYAPSSTGRADSVAVMALFAEALRSRYPDFILSEAFSTSDRSRSMANVSYTRNAVAIKGRYYFTAGSRHISLIGYYAPAAGLPRQRDLLMNIVSNLSFPRGSPSAFTRGAPPPITPIDLPLVRRAASDGSASIAAPADWTMQAGRGSLLTATPDGRAGFVFTSIEVLPSNYGVAMPQGVFVAPYSSPTQFVGVVFTRFGNRNVQVTHSQPDYQTMQSFPAYVGRQCQAEDLVVRYTSAQGVACVGVFKMINAAPSMIGHWFSMLSGFWAPEADFVRWEPLLEKIGGSFGINDQYARNYIQQGLANLRRLQQQTMQKMQELNQARYDNQAAWEQRQARKDFMDSKWDDYRRGNSYWVSEMEGGKVYATDPWGTRDTQTGNYYEDGQYTYTHFEGENPRHPSETMREINSYELKNYTN